MKQHIGILTAVAAALLLPPPAWGCECAESCGQATNRWFDKMKSLAGVWQSIEPDPQSKERVKVIYKITSGGSAVEEILMPGTSHEMVTMYFREGNKLAMTHYCMLGNEPHLHATAFENDTLSFDYSESVDIDPKKDWHMHALDITFIDPVNIRHRWVSMKDGTKEAPVVFTLKKQG